MSPSISATHDYLLQHYGPLLTLRHLAELMHTTPNGIRMAIARRRQPLTLALAAAGRPMGRRIYFEARIVAEIIDRDLASRSGRAAISRETRAATGLQARPGRTTARAVTG